MKENENREGDQNGTKETDSPTEHKPARKVQDRERIWRFDIMLVGITLIVIGVLLLFSTTNPEFDLSDLVFTYWPLLLIAAGVIKILQALMGVTSKGSGLGWLVFALVIMFIALGVHWEFIDSDDWGFRFGGFGFGMLVDSSSQQVEIAVGQKLELDMTDTDLKIFGYSGDRIKLSRKVYARGWGRRGKEERAKEFDVTVTRFDDVIKISSKPPERLDRDTRYYMRLEMQVPDRTVLSVAGNDTDVVVRDMEGNVVIETAEGDVNVRGVDGTVIVKSEAGSFDGRDLRGRLEVSGNRLNLDLDEIYGIIVVSLDRGNISLDNDFPVEGDISMATQRGKIDFEVHRDSEIDVDAAAESGRIYYDFGGIDIVEKREYRRSVNGGTYKVLLKTGSGSVKIDES